MNSADIWRNSLVEAEQTVNKFLNDNNNIEACVAFTNLLVETYNQGGNAFICGNGGSHCDAMHFAEEWTGRFRKERKPLGALALGDPSHTTCVSNDYGFEFVFSRQLEGLGRDGDLFIGISTSGNSQNVINAINSAKEIGMKTVALLGKDGGKMKDLVDLPIIVPAQTSDRIQEVHIKLIHTVIESVERALFPENYQ